MKVILVVTTWQVPFGQTVKFVADFSGDNADQTCLAAINAEAKSWWDERDGDNVELDSKEQPQHYDPEAHRNNTLEYGIAPPKFEFTPLVDLCDKAEWSLHGESGIQFFVDEATYARAHEAHYKKHYDDQGFNRPGYLINAYVAGHHPGELTEEQVEKYEGEQARGMAALEQAFNKPKH